MAPVSVTSGRIALGAARNPGAPMIMRARSILGLSSGLLAGALGRRVSFAEGGGGGARPPPAPRRRRGRRCAAHAGHDGRPLVGAAAAGGDLRAERRRQGHADRAAAGRVPRRVWFSVSHTTRARGGRGRRRPLPLLLEGGDGGGDRPRCALHALLLPQRHSHRLSITAQANSSSTRACTPTSTAPPPRRCARWRRREVLPPRHRRAGAARVSIHAAQFFLHTAQFPFLHRAPSS